MEEGGGDTDVIQGEQATTRKEFLRKVVKMHSRKKQVAVATTLALPQKKNRRKRRAESQLTLS